MTYGKIGEAIDSLQRVLALPNIVGTTKLKLALAMVELRKSFAAYEILRAAAQDAISRAGTLRAPEMAQSAMLAEQAKQQVETLGPMIAQEAPPIVLGSALLATTLIADSGNTVDGNWLVVLLEAGVIRAE